MTGPRAPGFGLFIGIFPFVCLLAISAFAADFDFPKLTGRVVDEANILSADRRSELATELARHEKRTSNQIVVVTVKSLQGRTIEEYGYQLGRYWGIGQKGKNNGVLLIVAPAERKVRIEVGYGLEDKLTDALSKLIIEQVIIPKFRAGRMQDGIVAGAIRIADVLETGNLPVNPPKGETGTTMFDWGWMFAWAVLLFVIAFVCIRDIFRSSLPVRQPCCSDTEKSAPAGALTASKKRECRYKDDYFGGYGGGFGHAGMYGGGGFGGGGGFSGGGGGFGGGGASGGW